MNIRKNTIIIQFYFTFRNINDIISASTNDIISASKNTEVIPNEKTC